MASIAVAILADNRPLKKGVNESTGLLGKFGKTARRLKMITGVGAGLFAAKALKSGYDRLTTIQDATKQLEVSLGDAGAAADFMQSMLKTVEGTPFNLDQFANAGSTMASMGLEAKKIPGYLTAIGETAAGKGKRANEFVDRLSNLFGKAATQGKITGQTLNQMAQAGVPALAILANEANVSTDEMRKMVSKGLVPASKGLDTLTKGIMNGTDGIAGATPKLAGTMAGLRDNLSGASGGFKAAIARFGANVITPWVGVLTTGFTTASDAIDKGGRIAGEAMTTAAAWVSAKASELKESFTGIDGGFSLANFDGAALGESLTAGLETALGSLGDLAGKLTDQLGAMASDIDFVALGIELGRLALPLALGLVTGIIDGVTSPGLWKGIWNNLPTILLAAVSIAFAPAKLIGPLARILSKIPLAGRFLSWMVTSLNKVGGKILKLGGNLIKQFADGFRMGLGLTGPGLIVRLVKFLGTILPRLKAWGATFAKEMFFKFQFAFLRAGDAVGQGVLKVLAKLGTLPGQIGRVFAGAGRWLLAAGVSIIRGLLDGIGSMFGKVRDKLTSLTNMLPDWKGPASKDKKILRKSGRLIINGLIDGLSDGAGGVRKNLTGLTNTIAKIGKSVGIKIDKGSWTRWLKDATKPLQNVANRYAKVGVKLAAAREKVKELVAAKGEFAATIRDAARDYANLSNIELGENERLTGGRMVQHLADRLSAIKTFTAKLAGLRGKLSNSLYEQIANMGVEEGMAYVDALTADPGAIKEMNRLQGQIDTESQRLGNQTASQLFNAGIQAAKGLERGLASRQKAILNQARKIAKSIAKEIKKALKIKSPSRILRRLGEWTGLGLPAGLEDSLGAVKAGARRLADTFTRAYKPPTIPPVNVPADAMTGTIHAPTARPTATAAARPIEININVTVPVGGSPIDTGREVARALDAYFKAGGRLQGVS